MLENIINQDIIKAYNTESITLRKVRLKDALSKANEKDIFELLKVDGSMISFLDDRLKDNREFALESVTYRSFFFREVYSDYHIESVGNIDNYMIFEISTAYNSLSERLKHDIDIIKTAKKSVEKIIKFLSKNDIFIDFDGTSIKMDNIAMIEIITEESLGSFEELVSKLDSNTES